MSWGSYHEKPRVQCTYYLHGKTGNSGWKINLVRIISFGRLQKIWAVIWDDAINLFFYPYQFVQLIWIYFVVGRSPTTSNLIDLFFCTRFPPGGLCKWCTSRVQQCSPKSISPMILLVILYYYMRNFCNLIGLEHSA